MTCTNCGSVMIFDKDYSDWCPNCNPPKNFELLTKSDSIKTLKSQITGIKAKLFSIFKKFTQENFITCLNNLRQKYPYITANIEHMHYYSISRSMALYLEFLNQNQNKKLGSIILNQESFQNELFGIITNLYIAEVHLEHIKKSRAIMGIYSNDDVYPEFPQIKYTENWKPIFERMIILDIMPQEPERNIFLLEIEAKKIQYKQVLERVFEEFGKGREIYNWIRWYQAHHFHFPWRKYPIRPKGQRLGNYFKFLKEIESQNKSILDLPSFNKIEKKFKGAFIKETFRLNKISIEQNKENVPLFVEFKNKIYIPQKLLHDFIDCNENLYIKKEAGKFSNLYGLKFEELIRDWINTLNVEIKDQNGMPLIHYSNPTIHPTNEILDVGFFHKKAKKFFVVESKAPVRFDITENGLDFNKMFEKDLNEFIQRDIPLIKQNLLLLGADDSYQVIPIFMNLGNFYGNGYKNMRFTSINGVHLTFSPADVIATVRTELINSGLTYFEIYHIPEDLKRISEDPTVKHLLSQNQDYNQYDLSDALNIPNKDQFIIDSGFIRDIDLEDFEKEITLEFKVQSINHYTVCIDIPDFLIDKFLQREIKIGDDVNVLIFRFKSFSPVLILGGITVK
jgi:hypothetical protein